MYTELLAQNNLKDVALKYMELGGSTKDKLAILKERIVKSNPRIYGKNYELPNKIYPITDVKVLMPLNPKTKETHQQFGNSKMPPAVISPRTTNTKSRTLTYDAKKLGATIAPATHYPPENAPTSNVPTSKISGNKNIFYPFPQYGQSQTVAAPPLTPQQAKNVYGKPQPPTRPNVISPVVRNTWEDNKDSIQRKPSMSSPVPPPAPVVVPSSTPTSVLKTTPQAAKGRIIEQANFGIRAFKHDVIRI